MAERRKRTHDPRQLLFFDFMANQIEKYGKKTFRTTCGRKVSLPPLHRLSRNSPFPSRQRQS